MTTFHSPPAIGSRTRREIDILSRPRMRGGTLLLVEDSRQTSDAIRQMFQGAGGRLRRADSLEAARRHLTLYAPDAVVVDLGLPDGSGLDLIAELQTRRPAIPLILAISGQPELETAALDAGADRFLAKPFLSVGEFRNMLAPIFFPVPQRQPHPGAARMTGSGLRDDLYLALELLARRDDEARREYALQFIAGLARSLGDIAMLDTLEDARAGGGDVALTLMLRKRLKEQPLI
ncbi:MAG: response regulator [Rhodobacteraceae bacterium]|nr:MAG: response regulator [Paracoccaceae bacterium]